MISRVASAVALVALCWAESPAYSPAYAQSPPAANETTLTWSSKEMTLRTGLFGSGPQTETSSPDLLRPADGPPASDLVVCEPGLPSVATELNFAARHIR
jgi:hypothetical protein